MSKYFCCSDIHSFASALKVGLNEAGFDINNSEHKLIILGDIFDRGSETIETYEFIKSIPQERRILIKGNHEYLFKALLDKIFPESYDFSNGTVRTFCEIAGLQEEMLRFHYWYIYGATQVPEEELDGYVKVQIDKTWAKIKRKVKKSEIYKFICSDEWRDYFELPGYVFVHSFVPLDIKEDLKKIYQYYPMYAIPETALAVDKNWRNAGEVAWEDATWGCPCKLFKLKLFREHKKLVVGHWHTSDFYEILDNDRSKGLCPIYDNGKLIGLDACTALTKRVNVLVIDEENIVQYIKERK